MKSAVLLLSLVAAASVSAEDLLAGQPACATACLSSAYIANGCALTDAVCACGPTSANIAAGAVGCLLASYTNSADLGAVQSVQAAACASTAGPTSVLSSVTQPPTSITPPPTFTTTTSSASTSSTPPPADDEKGGSPSSSLSSGASIGIGVGITLGVVALVAVAWLLFKRRRGEKAKKSADVGGQPEAMAFEADAKDAEYRPELEARQAPVEIGGDHHGQRPPPPPVELDGGGQRR